MSTKKTAILIFDSFQNEKGSGKSFIASKNLYDKLTNAVLKKAALSGIDYYHIKEDLQVGGTFGKCFSNALSSIYKKGYDNLITIGNDIPNLKVAHLIQAKKSLDSNSSVLGPTYDGGFYLLGLQKEYFNSFDFESFSWNTSKIASEVKTYIKQFTHQISILNYLYDIDTFLDLKKVYTTLSVYKKELRDALQKIIQTFIQNIIFIETNKFQLLVTCIHNKGSPLSSL